jgi:hypothetical protein
MATNNHALMKPVSTWPYSYSVRHSAAVKSEKNGAVIPEAYKEP